DPGVAVYFKLRGKPMCFACDKWARIEDNVHAINKTIGALRGITRWGSGDMMMQAFTGFVSLPAPEQPWQILGLDTSTPSQEDVDAAYKQLASKYHPDRMGGDEYEAKRVNVARDELYQQFGWH